MTTTPTIPLLIAVALLSSGCSVKMKMSDITGIQPKAERERVLVRVQVPGPTVGGEVIPLPLAAPIEDQSPVETMNLDGHIVSNAVAVVGGAVVFGRLEPGTQTARTPSLEKAENKR